MIYHPKLKRWFRLTTQNGLTCTVSGITLTKDIAASGGNFKYEFVDGRIRTYRISNASYAIFSYTYSTPQIDGLIYKPNGTNAIDAATKEFTYMAFVTSRSILKSFYFIEISLTNIGSFVAYAYFGYTSYYAGIGNMHITTIYNVTDFSNRYQPFGWRDPVGYTDAQKDFFNMYLYSLTPYGIKRDGNALVTSYDTYTSGIFAGSSQLACPNYKFYFVKYNSTAGENIKTNVLDADYGEWRYTNRTFTIQTKDTEKIIFYHGSDSSYPMDARDVMIFSYNMPDSDFRRLGLGLHPLSK